MVAALVIFLREGLEGSMIVAILCSALNRMGAREHFRDVFYGVAAGLGLAAGGGVAAYVLLRSWSGSRTQTIFEAVTYLVAVVVLTYMTFWMRRHAMSLSGELRAKTEAALDGGSRWGLGLLAFQAVGREGLETVVFTLAIVFTTSTKDAAIGAVVGLAMSLVIAFAIYRLGAQLNIRLFFQVVGGLLMVFAAGLLVDAIQNLQELGWIELWNRPLWSTSSVLQQGSALGDIAHVFFGYADHPTPLQVVVWVVFLAAVLMTFLLPAQRLARPAGPAEVGQRLPVGGGPPPA